MRINLFKRSLRRSSNYLRPLLLSSIFLLWCAAVYLVLVFGQLLPDIVFYLFLAVLLFFIPSAGHVFFRRGESNNEYSEDEREV